MLRTIFSLCSAHCKHNTVSPGLVPGPGPPLRRIIQEPFGPASPQMSPVTTSILQRLVDDEMQRCSSSSGSSSMCGYNCSPTETPTCGNTENDHHKPVARPRRRRLRIKVLLEEMQRKREAAEKIAPTVSIR